MLQLSTQRLLDRRLQTKVFRSGLAKSIHHARVLIRQRHIAVGKNMVDIPSFMVKLDSEKHINFQPKSPFGSSGRHGRVFVHNMKTKANQKKDGGDE